MGDLQELVGNQVQVFLFGLILRQDGAMASRNPLECLPPLKAAKKPEKMPKMPWGARGPGGPLGPPIPPRGTALRCSTSGAVYTGLSLDVRPQRAKELKHPIQCLKAAS